MTNPENLTQVVPFLRVSAIERSVRYYVEGLGFAMEGLAAMLEKRKPQFRGR